MAAPAFGACRGATEPREADRDLRRRAGADGGRSRSASWRRPACFAAASSSRRGFFAAVFFAARLARRGRGLGLRSARRAASRLALSALIRSGTGLVGSSGAAATSICSPCALRSTRSRTRLAVLVACSARARIRRRASRSAAWRCRARASTARRRRRGQLLDEPTGRRPRRRTASSIISSDLADGPQRDEVLLRAHHDAGDADLCRLAHRLEQQLVRLRAAGGGRDVVGRVVEDRVDLGFVDEVLDLDRVASTGRATRAPPGSITT